ncbi:LuxR C-terminal-related transcriptional regulator [Azospirillum agricola]|uniref:LuxR C-terminal-related transcriptional regulator n=1 Tax=Azospirillum agricola TaxID=1720247 RepID=UPI000A0F3BD0|nr:response regulator transcription factor [Azospirillum agricola]SMH38026.1 two component transcriptional regulator, LuxR family [Azospirillum lipoferum]
MTTLTVFLIDPNRLFRAGLKRVLDGAHFEVVGEAASLHEITASEADLMLIDPAAGDITERAFQTLRLAHPKARIVVLTSELDARHLAAALRAGANGYLRKDIASESLMQSLTLVMMGETVFPTELAALLLGGQTAVDEPQSQRKGLSPRETQILHCLLAGSSNKTIANHLKITEATVKVHLKSLLRKINATNRTQAAIWAMNNGIGQASVVPATV